MAGTPSLFIQFWRLQFAHSPLVRSSDRLERVLLILAVLLAVVAVPVTVTAAQHTYGTELQNILDEATHRWPATAITLADAASPASAGRAQPGGPGMAEVPAQWISQYGDLRHGAAPVAYGTAAGTAVPIWLDDGGNHAPAPRQSADAATAAISSGMLSWFAVAGLLGVTCWLAHRILTYVRYSQWAQEWKRLDRGHPTP